MSYAPYPAYKDSGVPWLGQVPEGWDVKRLSYATRFKGGSTPSKNEDQFWIDGSVPWVSPKDMKRKEINDTEDHLTELGALQSASGLIDPGHVMMVVRSGILRHSIPAAINRVPVTINQDMRVFLPFRELKAEFIYWVIEGLQKTLVDLWSKPGTTVESLETEYVNSSPFPVPSSEEQTAIADFLDKKTAEIDDLIAKKEKLLRLLTEQRTALITHTVTKGLNPNAPMKPSGIDWLGDVPHHWGTSRIDFECTVKARLGWKGLTASEYVDEGFIFLATPNIKGRKIDFENVNYINEDRYLESPEIMIKPGDILLAKDGSTLGTINLVRTLPQPATVNSSIAIIRPRQKNIDSAFLYRWLEADIIQSKIQKMKDGQGVPHLFQSDIRKFPLLLPPISEQATIAEFLDQTLSKIDLVVAKAADAIVHLREYRMATITSAVTGKIRVT